MGEWAEWQMEQEESLLADHVSGQCGGLGLCSLCDFESMTRLSVCVGKHIYVVSLEHVLKDDNFAIKAFLLGLGPFDKGAEGHVVRKERMPLKVFKERVEQYTTVDVHYHKIGPAAPIMSLGGYPVGCMSHPLADFFRVEDRPLKKAVW